MRTYRLLPDHSCEPVKSTPDLGPAGIGNRRVAQTKLGDGDVTISTVFLIYDHNFSGIGRPLLFETMIFGGAHDGYQCRCSTWDQALIMHDRAVSLANGGT